MLHTILMFLLPTLTLSLISTPTILFFRPDDATSTELEASIQFGMLQMRKSISFKVDHVIIDTDERNVVKSLVQHLDRNIIAILGVLTNEQVADLSPVIEAYALPLFVLNRLSKTINLNYVYPTTPSVEFQLGGLENILSYFGWDEINYFVQTNMTSLEDTMKIKSPCWNKTVLAASDISTAKCTDYTVVVVIGYQHFIESFLEHFSNLGCSNMVIVQFFAGNSVPFLPSIIDKNNNLGDLLFLFPKSYPMIEVGTSQLNTYKYTCLNPSCMKYKIRKQYRQTESVLLLLDTLTLIEDLIREFGSVRQDHIRGFRIKSVIGKQTALLSQGFSYNRINIFKSGSSLEADILGFVDERSLDLKTVTFWSSTLSDAPFKTRNMCSSGNTYTESPASNVAGVMFSDVIQVLTYVVLLILIAAVLIIFLMQRNQHNKLRSALLLICILSCGTILLNVSWVIKQSNFSCLMNMAEDMAEYVLYSTVLFICVSYDTSKLPAIGLLIVLLFTKFLTLTWTLLGADTAESICFSADFRNTGGVFMIALLLLSMFVVVMKHIRRCGDAKFLLLVFVVVFASELVLIYAALPAPCLAVLYSIRVVLINAGMCNFLKSVRFLKHTGYENAFIDDMGTDHKRFMEPKVPILPVNGGFIDPQIYDDESGNQELVIKISRHGTPRSRCSDEFEPYVTPEDESIVRDNDYDIREDSASYPIVYPGHNDGPTMIAYPHYPGADSDESAHMIAYPGLDRLDDPPIRCTFIESPQLFWDDEFPTQKSSGDDDTRGELLSGSYPDTTRSNGVLSDIEEDSRSRFIEDDTQSEREPFPVDDEFDKSLLPSEYAIVTGNSITDDIVLLKFNRS